MAAITKHSLAKAVRAASERAARMPRDLRAGHIADAIDLHIAESRAVDAEDRLRQLADLQRRQ